MESVVKKWKLRLLDSDREDVYYVDRWKRIWIQREGKLIRPERFDIYCHICKINGMKPKTQIYNHYSTFDS